MRFYKHRFALPLRPDTTVFVQTDEEVEVGNHIIEIVTKRWPAPTNYFHLRKGGHVLAMHRHSTDRHFARLDIADFFRSVSRTKVQRVLKDIGFSFAEALDLSHRSCVHFDGRRSLPFGYVQSPILASLVLDKSALGQAIRSAKGNGVFVSVFMDDIIISHSDDEAAVADAVTRIEAAAVEARFSLAADKRQGPADSITAFNIILTHGSLAITPDRLEDFAREVLQWGNTPQSHGILGYVASVNTEQAKSLSGLIKRKTAENAV